jgi:asparagine synthase (glutamine-hydrolysing)
MCGICGIVSFDAPLSPELRHAIDPMTDALAHRGPDGRGVYRDTHAVLGHRRLAIIDRAGGAQPMPNEDRTVWVVFNGEIYNHRELRHHLAQKGHRFATTCDTEVIVHAYEEFGAECVSHLEGMFAFAVYDTRSRALFAARDRLGKKPFFYSVLGGTVHFASEIKALALSPLWDDAWDAGSLESYLSLGYVVAPSTIYRHVRKLDAGHWLLVQNGHLRTGEYWDIECFDDLSGCSETVVIQELERLLRHAVADRLESEVPLGAFLSGGIDSSLVASMMTQLMPSPPRTITVGFREKDYTEIEAAFATARALGTEHHADVLEPDITEDLDSIIGHFDEPFADSSAVPMYYLARAARRQVTVALTGDGGDEGFSGYALRYVPHMIEMRLRPLFRGASGRAAADWLAERWPRARRMPRPLRLGGVLGNLGRDPASAYYVDLSFLKPWTTRELLGLANPERFDQSETWGRVTDVYRKCPSVHSLQRTQYADLKLYLPNDVLVKVDRMTMLNGLEVRCPLLDRRLVEFAFRIPATDKMPRLHAKHLLRRLAARRLSPALAARPKRGFDAPVEHWLTGRFGPQLAGDLFGSDAEIASLLDQERLRDLYEGRQGDAVHNSYVLWASWVLERWLRIRRDGRTSSRTRLASLPAAASGTGALGNESPVRT